MKREIEVKLEAIEEIIAKQRETCCKNLAETLRVLKRDHPEEFAEILQRVLKLLDIYNVNCETYLKDLHGKA
ncbi:MAG: hypothetical protein II453_08310 [Alphaproteobacteria bacterium]|nr:hypothetical protein [Alphaproteobacteria bacterium]